MLEAAGLQVSLAPNGCCGRPLISQGLLAEARAAAQLNTDRLYPLAASGARFVFFEPSCLSAMREDVPSLLRGEAQRQAAARGRAVGALRGASGAASRSAPVSPLPGRAPGDDPPPRPLPSEGDGTAAAGQSAAVADSGGRRRRSRCRAAAAWPVRSAMPWSISRSRARSASGACCRRRDASRTDAVLVASGVSCRHQIADFTGAGAPSGGAARFTSSRRPHEPRRPLGRCPRPRHPRQLRHDA